MRPRSRTATTILVAAGLALAASALAAAAGWGAAPPTILPGTGLAAGVAASLAPSIGLGPAAEEAPQYWRRRRRAPPRYPDPGVPIDDAFVFARVEYTSVRGEPLGTGWTTDYPDGDANFMSRWDEFTTSRVNRTSTGYPEHVVVTLYDEELFSYPFIFMSDVGTVGFDEIEVERLRSYLLRGGFLWVDDFWGWRAWEQWERQIRRVLPAVDYPLIDIPPDHPIRQMMYNVETVPQIPSIQWWRRSGRYTTSERGEESAVPHFRAIVDDNDRILVMISHNTDIADGWERENDDWDFFDRFSSPAYAVGLNVVLYARTH